MRRALAAAAVLAACLLPAVTPALASAPAASPSPSAAPGPSSGARIAATPSPSASSVPLPPRVPVTGPAPVTAPPTPLPATGAAGPEVGQLKVVVAGVPRYDSPRSQRLYLAGPSGLTQVSTDNSKWYDWPGWALNGTALVYSIRADEPATLMPPGQEAVWMVDADGVSHPRQLTSNAWRDYQPKVTADGRSLVFSSMWNEYRNVGLYRMDLSTFDVTNLSSQALPLGASDADPRLAADSGHIVFASSLDPNGTERRTQIFEMSTAGAGRTRLTQDAYLDTDPALSPDGRYVAFSAYLGTQAPATDHPLPSSDWHIVVLDLQTGQERVLTGGQACVDRPDSNPCSPADASAWVPIWSPDGSEIGFIAHVSQGRSGIYAIRPDGTGAHVVVDTGSIAPNYWDWTPAGAAAPRPATGIGTQRSATQLLVGGHAFLSPADQDQPARLFTATRDRWNQSEVTIQASGLSPTFARWTPDRRQIVFTARVPFDPGARAYGPAAPPGRQRHEHYILGNLLDTLQPAVRNGPDVAQEQVFIMNADGSGVRQLTTPWTEDWLEAQTFGDMRANTDPDVSPDGRYVIFTNSSTLTDESFILRLDLQTGEVINLTAISSGAMPTADSFPRWSPDGRHIAFSSVVGSTLQLFVMGADGSGPRPVTDDTYVNIQPAWSPDGSNLVYTSYRGAATLEHADTMGAAMRDGLLPNDGWDLVRVPAAGGAQQVLVSSAAQPALRGVWSPEGDRIAFVSLGAGGQPDIFAVAAEGGPAVRLQSTTYTKEEFVDWR